MLTLATSKLDCWIPANPFILLKLTITISLLNDGIIFAGGCFGFCPGRWGEDTTEITTSGTMKEDTVLVGFIRLSANGGI